MVALLKKGDTRLEKLQEEMQQDRAFARHIWSDFVPRAALHFIESTDNPQYQCPPYLGLKQEEEARVEKLLEVQKEIDELRAEYAETLRKHREEHLKFLDSVRTKRKGVVVPMAGEGLPMFWLTTIRNVPDPELWQAVTDRDELALKYVTEVSWHYTESRQGMSEPEDCDFLKAPPQRGFRIEMSFDKCPFFSNEKLWVEFSWKSGSVKSKSSGVSWNDGKCITARQRDIGSNGKPNKYRTSMFKLFEPSRVASSGQGLWDDTEKLAMALHFKAEVIPNAVLHYCRDPENDGLEGEEGDDLGDDTDSDEDDDSADEEEEEEDTPQAKAERAQNKRKKTDTEGMMKRIVGNRDPCVMFVIFIMALNLLIVPISIFMEP